MVKLEDISDWEELKNQVVCGDCLEGMKLIPDNSVDLVLTDPPYNASNSNIGFKDGYKTLNEDWDKNFEVKPYLDECFRIIREGGSILAFCSYHTLGQYLNYGAKVQQIIHWEHISAMPAIAKVYTPVVEYIVWFSTPRYTFDKTKAKTNVIKCLKPHQMGEWKKHPTQKPNHFMKLLLEVHSREDDLILDPFMGSWTTARACKDLGRNFIGFELEEKYCEIGEKRLEQECLF